MAQHSLPPPNPHLSAAPTGVLLVRPACCSQKEVVRPLKRGFLLRVVVDSGGRSSMLEMRLVHGPGRDGPCVQAAQNDAGEVNGSTKMLSRDPWMPTTFHLEAEEEALSGSLWPGPSIALHSMLT